MRGCLMFPIWGKFSVSGSNAALHLESLIPVDIVSLEIGQQKVWFIFKR